MKGEWSKVQRALVIFMLLIFCFPVFAYQDCIVSSDGKLTDISIEDNTILDVYPLVTLMNDKHTLIVHPLKEGKTRFCVLKNNKNIVMFNVAVHNDVTKIEEVEGFDVLSIDEPPDDSWLDLPPLEGKNIGGQNG